MFLLLDNYDSFTYNLRHYLGELGAEVEVRRNDAVSADEASMDEVEQVRAVHPRLVQHVGPPCFVRAGPARPRCPEGSHFCGVTVWRSFPAVERVL